MSIKFIKNIYESLFNLSQSSFLVKKKQTHYQDTKKQHIFVFGRELILSIKKALNINKYLLLNML